MNKFLVLILLAGLLYGLYRYHQLNMSPEKSPPEQQQQNKKPPATTIPKRPPKEPEFDNLSQISVGSIDDYKQDSVVNSLESKDSLSFLDNASNGSFFFHKS
jgi:hypothetical protein